MTIKLRPYQNEAIEMIINTWKEGITRQLISLPTGCGKTITFAELTRLMETKTLIIAHTDELVNQAINKLQLVLGMDASIGKCKAQDNDINKKIVVASIQTISRDKRLDQLQKYDFNLCVIDEAHHAAASSYKKVIEELGFINNNPEKLLVGFTATPKRSDNIALCEVFEKITYEKNILDMVDSGYLCDLRGKRIATGINLSGIDTRLGDFVESQLAAVVNTDDRNQLIVKAYKENSNNKKAIAFCVNVKHSQDLSDAFNSVGISSKSVYGDMDFENRKSVLSAFANGSIQVLTNCMVLTEGFDEPSIETILMARPTKSNSIYTQCVGRGTRLFPSKKECLVLDFTDQHNKIPSLGSLLGKGKHLKQNKSILETIVGEKTENEAIRTNGKIVGLDFDLFERSNLKWSSIPGGHFRLSVGLNKYINVRNLGNGRYTAFVTENDKNIEILAEVSDLEMCTGIGEDFARRSKSLNLAHKNASWRNEPASLKQTQILKDLGYSIPQMFVSKGEASDLIEQEKCKRDAWKLQEPTNKQIYFLKNIGKYYPKMTKGEASRIITSFKK